MVFGGLFEPQRVEKRGNAALPEGIDPRPGDLENRYYLPRASLTSDQSYNHIPIQIDGKPDLWDQYYWDQKYILDRSIEFMGSVDVYGELVRDNRIKDFSHLYDKIEYR